MKTTICLSLILFSFSISARVPYILYTVKKESTLDDIVCCYTPKVHYIYNKKKMKKMTKLLNPKIKNWNKIEEGVEIKLHVSKKHLEIIQKI